MTTKITDLPSLITAAEADPECHFFSPDTMRFFKARSLDAMPIDDNSGYFVGSKRSPYGPRTYEVRKYHLDPVTNHLYFDMPDDFDTAAKARSHARKLATA